MLAGGHRQWIRTMNGTKSKTLNGQNSPDEHRSDGIKQRHAARLQIKFILRDSMKKKPNDTCSSFWGVLQNLAIARIQDVTDHFQMLNRRPSRAGHLTKRRPFSYLDSVGTQRDCGADSTFPIRDVSLLIK